MKRQILQKYPSVISLFAQALLSLRKGNNKENNAVNIQQTVSLKHELYIKKNWGEITQG